MKNLNLYYHGGSKNHGCEAIVRSTAKLIDEQLTLFSFDKSQDEYYGLDKNIKIKADIPREVEKFSLSYMYSIFFSKFLKSDYAYICNLHKSFFDEVNNNSIYLSVGGDNYCYKGREILGYYNKKIHKKGAKTVLWGCSFEPDDLSIPGIKDDLALYDAIIARERISYDALKKVNNNTFLFPDPAFQLEKDNLPLPNGFLENKTIGVNLSPLVCNCGNEKLIFNNYRNLLKNIIVNTDFNIALIPHVVLENSDDRVVLQKLFNEFAKTNRVILIDDCNCMQLKGFISRCRMFVGARTHSTIAAYSTGVPTLVTGYSVKARGIAKEIFGTDDNFVLPIQGLKSDNDLTNAFIWLSKNESSIKNHLIDFMPEYKDKALNVKDIIDSL